MADADELWETVMRELNDVVMCDGGDTEEEPEKPSFLLDTVSEDIPPSLLSYFESSKSRALRSEKFILEELEDLSASRHTEDMKNLPDELDKDMTKKPVTFDTENEYTSPAETHLLFAPRETLAPFSQNLSVCPDSEDEAETDEYMGPGVRTIKSPESHREHREKRHCEEMKTEERRRQRHRDFQEELKKIMEAEKLHQRELELREKRAQEKLEQEFLLQQELISNLQKRVEEEKKTREKEQKRIKEEGEKKRKEEEEKRRREEDRRKKEDERIQREKKRKRMEEQMKRKEEEKRKIEEIKLKEEHRRKREEEQRKMEEEEKRRIEEEEKRKKEEEERWKKEEERKMLQEDMRKKEEDRKIKDIRLKEEEKMRQIEGEERERKQNGEKIKEMEKKRKNEEEVETRAVDKMMAKKMEEDKRRKNQEEMVQEQCRKEEKQHGSKNSNEENKKREEERRIPKELEVRTKTEEMKKVDERKIEEKGKNIEEETMVAQQMNTKEEDRDIKKMQLKEDGEKSKKEEEMKHSMECNAKKKEEVKTAENEERKWLEQQVREQKEEEHNNKKEMEQNGNNRKMEHELKTKDDVKRNKEADKWQIKEDVRKDQEEKIKTEERGVKGEEKSFRVQDTEKDERLKQQEKRRDKDGLKNQTKNITLSSSCTVSLQSQSTVCPSRSENVQQLDPNKSLLYTSTSQTIKQDADVSPRTSSCPLPMCLPEHTEQKRLSWMRDCVPWSRLSLQDKSKQNVHARSRRGLSRASEACSLPPVCPQTLLRSTGCKSLQEVTTVTLEDLPGCSLVTLAQCPQLQSLTLRRCGLKSLEGFNQLPQLRCIDVQENSISFVDCENMASLQVLRLGHNKLTSIHGLSGAENLNVLDLSHNSITRIAGLESIRRLQRLSLDHNQLISTKGLRDTCTLLHLDCSHNHLASVEGLENCALLQTLDLRSNSLTEPPSVNNHILLRELHLDDNSISSLQGLAVCWLPLMHHLSAAENRITLLPSMSDFVSLTNLDLRFNCMSELQNVCEGVKGCLFLQEVHLSGNPLQQEIGWRCTLQRAVAGLRAIDGEETDPFLSAPAVQQLSLASGSFLTFCQAQLKQIRDLQLQHSRELSNAPTPLDAVKSSCRHFTETLKLAVDQRFAHEYGDTIVSAGQTLDMDSAGPKKLAEHSEIGSTEKPPPVILNRNNINWTLDLHSLATKETTTSSHLNMAPVSNHQDLDPKNTAAVVIQQRWRKYRQKRGNISSPPTAEKGGERGGEGGTPESGPSDVDRSAVGQDYAATIIQAFWRGYALRRRLATALAAVTCPDSGEDEAFEEVDVDGFVFDEAALEKHWTLPLSEESSSRHHYGSKQPLSLKLPGPFPELSQRTHPPSPSWRPKQAWEAGEQVESTGMKVSPESSIRSKSPASTAALSGLSARSEKILQEWGFHDSNTALLMLKRAQKMRSKKQQQIKHKDPSVCLALFRNCKYQQAPVEARNRPAPHNRNHMKVCRAELDLQQAEQTEQVKQERAEQWLHTQSDRDSESEHFLPEISSVVLNGGRVQLVADPAKAERLHHASGLWASSSLVAQPCKERNYLCSNSLGHARKEVLSPHRVKSAPSRKERISFRDNPVQLSGGWGGGKKRDKVYK